MLGWLQRLLGRASAPDRADTQPAAAVATTASPPAATPSAAPSALQALIAAMREQAHAVTVSGDLLQVAGLQIRVRLHEHYRENDHARSVTETIVGHARFGSAPVVEFQFGAGSDAHDAMLNGFRAWCQLDLVVLIDALRDQPEDCQYMSWNAAKTSKLPPDGGAPLTQDYRVLFGPIQHFLADPARLGDDENPGFCPCCLFTESLHAFLPLMRDGGLISARLFVARDADGIATADCRVNGEDYAPVQQSLIEWVAKWSDRGFEWRKQYVLALPMPHDDDATAQDPTGETACAS